MSMTKLMIVFVIAYLFCVAGKVGETNQELAALIYTIDMFGGGIWLAEVSSR
jgi:hypothetical protein